MAIRGLHLLSVALGVAVGAAAVGAERPAHAQSCPNNPDAIGTSRVMKLAPGPLMHVGTMQYDKTLPLADHEVVITFDDGPLPPYSNQILDILAANCVKVTYFLVGEMAQNFPAVVRRMYQDGHTLGTHSQDHPLRFDRISDEKVRWEIDRGIANVAAALGDPTKLAPYFRIPGLGRTPIVESDLAARSLIVFSADVVADDWHRRIKPAQIVQLAINRLEARGRGILLLHDIHPTTVAALPELLTQLKAHGFRIVQLVPGRSGPTIVAGAMDWALAWASGEAVADEARAAPNWPPATDAGVASDAITLPVPDQDAFNVAYALAPKTNTGDVEVGMQLADAGSVVAGEPSNAATASAQPRWPEPSMQDSGLAVWSPPLSVEPPKDATTPKAHVRVAARPGRRHPPRRARAPAEGKHADLMPTVAALMVTEPPAAATKMRTAAR